ncbi:MFS transporter (macronuclear) [Tetrahymena thermophila SB210]|uniref:MFS transporter n=1 Tax=Tetrahymena thermophila (strain SB210) TaxID=312017 RepID=W7X0Q7_TETTS|nr:MFS transporter [Tetrahymena thermophila SB210]EWS72745.1 MFS transporter [Tetrahymena thermophila SB210]|eukprot:XP_012654723.1 MFS transporter [Tetrahymena thermophila SB210]
MYRLSTLGLPKRSPTLVLTQPQGAQLRSSNGIRCFHLSMADNKIYINECLFIFENKLSYRHWDFPSGPPPQYQPSLKALNFGVRMGSGVFTLVWPITKYI